MEEYKNIENNMNAIIHETCKFGHICEEVYHGLNIIRDRDSNGREVIAGCHNFTRKLSAYQMPYSQTSNKSQKGKTFRESVN